MSPFSMALSNFQHYSHGLHRGLQIYRRFHRLNPNILSRTHLNLTDFTHLKLLTRFIGFWSEAIFSHVIYGVGIRKRNLKKALASKIKVTKEVKTPFLLAFGAKRYLATSFMAWELENEIIKGVLTSLKKALASKIKVTKEVKTPLRFWQIANAIKTWLNLRKA